MIRLNMLLLFFVTLEPYLFNLLVIDNFGSASSTRGNYTSSFFAIDIGIMSLVMAYFTHLLTVEGKKLVPSDLFQRFKISRNPIIAATAVFMFSALPVPILWDTNVTLEGLLLLIVLWIASVPLIWAARTTMSHQNPKQIVSRFSLGRLKRASQLSMSSLLLILDQVYLFSDLENHLY